VPAFILKMLIRLTYPFASGVMTVSNGVKADLIELGGFRGDQVKVIYNPAATGVPAKMNNEEFVGVVVMDSLRRNWELIREPDRNGIKKALNKFGGNIDLCHYDSDKSYYGRMYAYPIL